MYANGRGVAKDLKLEYMWVNIASAGDKEFGKVFGKELQELRELLEANMTRQQIQQARALSIEWLKAHGR